MHPKDFLTGLDNSQIRLIFSSFKINFTSRFSLAQFWSLFLPAHECQRLLPLNLSPLTRQLLLLVCERLLHQHHSNALLHRIFSRLYNRLALLCIQSRQRPAKNAQHS